jgi:hypothetical protein
MSERTFIVWADPGLLTGLAWYDIELDGFNSGQYDPDDLRRKLRDLEKVWGPRMTLGYERFNVTGGPRNSSPEHAHKAIRSIEDFCQDYKIPLLTPQPSSARNLGSVTFLRRLGWYRAGRGHANDAAQHLLADLLKRKPMPTTLRAKLFPGYVDVVPSPPE